MNKIWMILPSVSAVIGTALMILLLAVQLVRYFATVLMPDSAPARLLNDPDSHKKRAGKWKDAFLCAAIWFAASRAFIFCVASIYANAADNSGYFAYMFEYWAKWDAPHYLGLIENWYVNEGDPRFHIVFFPMYPLVCRLLLPFFGGNVRLSAMCISNLCGYLAGVMLYQHAALDHGRKAACRTVKFFFLNPLSFFLSLPYTESLFILLTVAAVYLARRRRFAWALAIGAMCAATRLMGVVVAIPIFYTMLTNDRENGLLTSKRAFCRFFSCFAVLAGVAAYLLLNWHVTGNPFQFWIYQREHWHNTTGTLWNTFGYIVDYAINGDMPMRAGTWIPTVVLIYGAIVLLLARARKTDPGDAAYSWAYMYMTIVPTWLISGPRYVSGLYSLYPMLGACTHRKWADIALTIVFAAALGYMSSMFVFTSGVY